MFLIMLMLTVYIKCHIIVASLSSSVVVLVVADVARPCCQH